MRTTSEKPPQLSLRARLRYWWRRVVKPISKERRAEVQVHLRDASHPDFDYFVLVLLSSVIATQGLLVDSPAIVIGAMLVAPLMSPVIGLGLSSITGDERLLRDSASALLRGAFLAVIVSLVIAWINRHLPFVVLLELPNQVITRTTPSPIDLTVALAGGAAAAFALAMPNISAALPGVAIATALMPPLCTIGIGLAMGRMDVAGGATLLFITSAVTITFAASLVFFSLGFRGPLTNSQQRVPRSLFVSAILTLVLLGSLSYLSYRLFETANDNRMIEMVLYEEVDKVEGVELIDWKATSSGEILELDIVLRTLHLIRYEDSVALQKAIADRLQRPVAVIINQVHAAQLDPLVPPTSTLTPSPTLTSTPGPSPTLTYTPTKKPTSTPAPTETSTPTLTPTFTATPTSTPTPALAKAVNTAVPGLRLRQWPAGPEIAVLRQGEPLIVLYGKRVLDGLVWLEVEDKEGRVGWIPEIYLFVVTLTPTNTPTPTATGTPAATMMGTLSPTP